MKEKITFEKAMAGLEEAVTRLESGELTLDESISVFEEAVKLVGVCQGELEAAELKVKILTQSPDGTLSDAPFSLNKDEA